MAFGAVITDVTPAEPALYGILSSAVTVVEDLDGHWTRGVEFLTPDCQSDVTLTTICNTTVSVSAVDGVGGTPFDEYYPFAVQTSFRCSTMSLKPEEVEEQARRALELCTQKAVEYELWTGALAKAADVPFVGAYPNRYLASTESVDVTPTPGTAVKTKFGLALLERAIGNCGCGVRGTIHAPRDVASSLGLKAVDGHLETSLGTKVVAGVGYTGTSPTGSQPTGTQAWMYATGPVTVRLGPIEITPGEEAQSVNTSINETVYYAERIAAPLLDSCCVHAVLVDLALDYS